MPRRTPNALRNATLNVLLDRLESLETAQELGGEDRGRTYRREIGRVRDLLSQYCGRSNPSRDMFL